MTTSWQTKKLGDVVEVVNGGTPKTNVSKYWNGDILWITPKDMGRLSDTYVENTERQITKAGLEESSAKIIPPNSIILSTRAPIGHLAINKKEIATNQGCKGLVPSKTLETKYLFYFLENSISHLESLGSGTTFKELSGSKLKEVEIPLPSIAEQKQIAKKLDEVFEQVTKAKEAAEKNLHNAEELFESYLNNVFANPGKDWEEKRLGDVFYFKNGRSFKKSEWRTKGLPIIRIQNLNNANSDFNYFDGEYEKNIEVNPRDLLFSWSGTVGSSFGPHIWRNTKGVLNQHIFKVDFDNGLDKYFCFYFFKYFTKEIERSVNGAVGLVHITKAKLNNFKIFIPKVSEQKSIVKKLDSIYEEAKKLEKIYEQRLSDLEELKKSILSKAFHAEL